MSSQERSSARGAPSASRPMEETHGYWYGVAVSRMRARVPDRTDLHVRVVLRPARGDLRLRRDRVVDLARAGRRRARVDLALRAVAARGRPRRPPSGPRAPCLPGPPPAGSALAAGWTPLIRAERLGAELGLGDLWLKDDTRNPTNSFKDRVVAVALAKALEFGFKTAACASTGNLANAVAAAAARTGLNSFVFVPSDLEAAKLLTTAVYGGNVVAIDGNYDDVNRLCAELAAEYPWAFANINVRPFYAEGSKTIAYETVEQLGWQAPDHVVVPVGSGSLLPQGHKAL